MPLSLIENSQSGRSGPNDVTDDTPFFVHARDHEIVRDNMSSWIATLMARTLTQKFDDVAEVRTEVEVTQGCHRGNRIRAEAADELESYPRCVDDAPSARHDVLHGLPERVYKAIVPGPRGGTLEKYLITDSHLYFAGCAHDCNRRAVKHVRCWYSRSTSVWTIITVAIAEQTTRRSHPTRKSVTGMATLQSLQLLALL